MGWEITTIDGLIAGVRAAGDDPAERGAVVAAVDPTVIESALHGQVGGAEARVLASGTGASPGAGTGRVYFTADAALDAFDRGEDIVLACAETTPADEPGMRIAEAIVTARGGLTSHAAVVARGLGLPAVCGAAGLSFADGVMQTEAGPIAEGDVVTVDGSDGTLLFGDAGVTAAEPPPEIDELLSWADAVTAGRVRVRANADNGEDAAVARRFGAVGIGLCRTEHQFLGERLASIQAVILAADPAAETAAIAELEAAQTADFEALLAAMDGLPVTVRLLDPPLHEFLPDITELEVAAATGALDAAGERLLAAAREIAEHNPMLGTRGVRLGILRPELYRMQVRAIAAAVATRRRADGDPRVEIMVPLIADPAEMAHARTLIRAVLDDLDASEAGDEPPAGIAIGSMVETPRAALTCGALADHVDFVSFGTNDLTQMTFGFSRDDLERQVLPAYRDQAILTANPFETLDADGVGALVRGAITAARAVRADLKVGICGEHGGDPASIAVLVDAGVDYVSCSPYRVPVARLAVAQALLAP